MGDRGLHGRRRRRPRGSITADEILRGAWALTEGDGLDELTMPRLADRLGIGVTSIYSYFSSKQDLLDHLAEDALREFYDELLPLPDLEWQDVLWEYFTKFRMLCRKRRILHEVIVNRNGALSPQSRLQAWGNVEKVVDVLVEAGFDRPTAVSAYFHLSLFTRGSIIVERTQAPARARGDVRIDPRSVPEADQQLAEAFNATRDWARVHDDDFAFGLQNTIRGLVALLGEQVPGESRRT